MIIPDEYVDVNGKNANGNTTGIMVHQRLQAMPDRSQHLSQALLLPLKDSDKSEDAHVYRR